MFVVLIAILCLVCVVLLVVYRRKTKRIRMIEDFILQNSPSVSVHESEDGNLLDRLTSVLQQKICLLDSYFQSDEYVSFSDVSLDEELHNVYNQVEKLQRHLSSYKSASVNAAIFIGKYNSLEKTRRAHNEAIVQKQLDECEEYFDTLLAYPLDIQQRQAIVSLEDNTLVVSGAGSGKTSTMCGKIRYLVDKKAVDPRKILVITYTRKAAESLTTRLAIPGLRCYTFHKLSLEIIAQQTQKKPSICSDSIFVSVFESLKNEPKFKKSLNRYLASYQSTMKDEFEYDSAASYIADRKKYGIKSPYPDMDGRTIYTKSEQEKKICVFLSEQGVRFRYEKPYEHKVNDAEYRQYTPDFSIYYKSEEGVEKRLYLEHFGVDANGNVAKWMGDAEEGGWSAVNAKYNAGIEWKKALHEQYETDLIYTTSADFSDKTVYKKLQRELESRGVKLSPLSEDAKSEYLLGASPRKERELIELLSSFVMLLKGKCKTIEEVLDEVPSLTVNSIDNRNRFVLKSLVLPYYERYGQLLSERGEIDFTDAILWASQLCNDKKIVDYDHILVDEFQDISLDRYHFLKSMRHSKTKLFCVGDDWQSIYRFSGSDLTLFTHFKDYFGYTTECNIETTYRFGNPVLQQTSDFIRQNPQQKAKHPKPFEDTITTNYEFVGYLCNGGTEGEYYLSTLKRIVDTIPQDKSILFVGRYTMDVEVLSGKCDTKCVGGKISVRWGDREIPFMTVHQSKGLEADYVILLKCNAGNYGFPATITDDPILSLVLSEEDGFAFGEERRLFYVALTRAKDKTFVLYDIEHPSCFVEELQYVERGNSTAGEMFCPKCRRGRLVKIKSGLAKSGYHYTSYVCSNQDFGCNYFHTEYY